MSKFLFFVVMGLSAPLYATQSPEFDASPYDEPPPSLAEADGKGSLTTPALPSLSESDGWSFTLEPYVWATGLTGQAGIKGHGPAEVNMNARSVLQNLEWAVMARGEVRKGHWGLLGDGIFSQLSASGDPTGPLYKNAHARVQQGMASLALAFRLLERREGFIDVYAGARFNLMAINLGADPDSAGIQSSSEAITQRLASELTEQAAVSLVNVARRDRDLRESLDRPEISEIMSRLRQNSAAYRELAAAASEAQKAEVRNAVTSGIRGRLEKAKEKFSRELAREIEKKLPTSVDGEQWWVDPIVGLRGQVNLTRWLYLAAQGDVGGFGAGSKFAAMAQATVGVNFTRHIFGEIGYRYFYMDYARSGAVYDAAEYGIFSGIGVRF